MGQITKILIDLLYSMSVSKDSKQPQLSVSVFFKLSSGERHSPTVNDQAPFVQALLGF